MKSAEASGLSGGEGGVGSADFSMEGWWGGGGVSGGAFDVIEIRD